MVELADLFKPEKRYLIGKKVIDLEKTDNEILIKIGNRVLRCRIDGFQQQAINPFAYNSYNTNYNNQTAVSTAYSTCNYFAINTLQSNKVNLDLYVYGEIIV